MQALLWSLKVCVDIGMGWGWDRLWLLVYASVSLKVQTNSKNGKNLFTIGQDWDRGGGW